MKRLLQLALAATLALGISFPALAQHRVRFESANLPPAQTRGGTPTMRVSPVQVVPISPRTRQVTTLANPNNSMVQTTNLGNTAFIATASPLTVQQLLNPVPGLGFDFAHLAAINRNLDVQALIDPLTQQRLALAERLLQETPVVPVGFPLFAPASPVILVEQQPPIVILQQPPPVVVEQPQPAAMAPSQTQSEAAPAPLSDAGEFVLVRRDGSLVFAVGFSQLGNRIVYITREGIRRSLLVGDLDLDATENMNEERGTTLHLTL
jgi:hypothetical protein